MRILMTGATGVIGTEVGRRLPDLPGIEVTRVARRAGPGVLAWAVGTQEPPGSARGPWDVIVHMAASTRWTMSQEQAYEANLRPAEAVLTLAGPHTHLVHVSTAYVGGDAGNVTGDFGPYRNGYEWSKARCEELLRERHDGPLTVIRPPLVLGSSVDGSIARFSGPYTILQSLLSGLAAVVVGSPDGYAETAPVDQVADVITAAALGDPPASGRQTETIAGGERSLRLSGLLDIVRREVNAWRAARGIDPITMPPTVSFERWHRFFLPFAEQHLSPIQNQAVQLLGMFESYTSMAQPFTPTQQVADPAEVLARSVRYWADARPRIAGRAPEAWALVGAA